MTKTLRTVYSRFRKAIAPEWICSARATIAGVPGDCLLTYAKIPRATASPRTPRTQALPVRATKSILSAPLHYRVSSIQNRGGIPLLSGDSSVESAHRRFDSLSDPQVDSLGHVREKGQNLILRIVWQGREHPLDQIPTLGRDPNSYS
jgi:hypothetical protein